MSSLTVCLRYLTQRPESRQQVIAGRVQRRLETGSKNRPGSFTICSLILNSEDTRREVNAQQKPKTNRIPTRSLTSALLPVYPVFSDGEHFTPSFFAVRGVPSQASGSGAWLSTDSHTGLGSSCSWVPTLMYIFIKFYPIWSDKSILLCKQKVRGGREKNCLLSLLTNSWWLALTEWMMLPAESLLTYTQSLLFPFSMNQEEGEEAPFFPSLFTHFVRRFDRI